MLSSRNRSLSTVLVRYLQHPMVIPGLASCGIHLLLFAALPILPNAAFSEDEPDIRRSVEVVELTPEEQQRLPDFSTPSVDLPSLLQDNQSPSTENLVPLLPVPNTPLLPSLDELDDLLATDPYAGLPSYRTRSSLPPATIPDTQEPEVEEPEVEEPTTEPSEAPDEPANQFPNQQGRRLGAPLPEEAESATEEPEEPESAQEDGQEPQPSASAIAPDSAEQPDDPAPNPGDVALARVQQLRALLARDTTGINPDNPGDSSYGNIEAARWLYDELQLSDNDFEQLDPIQAPYPEDACILQDRLPEGLSAIFGVVVDADDKVVNDPRLIRSSGLAFFNQAAKQAILDYSFDNPTNRDQPYIVTVQFEEGGDTCPANLPQPNPPS